jgi:hypothetical protein
MMVGFAPAARLRPPIGGRKETMDTKSASILGSCLIIAALIAALVPRPQASTAATQVGRFQMSGVPGHAYVIDTITGQVWEQFATTGEGRTDQDFSRSKVK